ncbi:TetR/AcrR family transcriptional regulator [Nocardia yamanashiensis]|uniref:TetR/AcrR family transcriptional regulator n=1 Tax=Nocardia yamanashiensis TaxID=209247 RepID=UPI001E564B4C|nr:TetR/AcrR family transcriptional regulator [Nocardia yamanashiensis]UGT42580.1 TetR/AcrR family transcriptional regulator [Nocardia yamanashiensis]
MAVPPNLDPAAPSGLAARKRQMVQAHVSAVAMRLFQESGFAETTADQIAAAAGMSRTSFFRYFATKEDTVLFHTDALGAHIRAVLESRPDGENAWDALRNAMTALPALFADRPDGGLAEATLVIRTPAIRARNHDKLQAWITLLAPETARRLGADPDDPADPRPRAMVAATLACFDIVTEIWVDSGGTADLSELLERAMSATR